MPIPRQVVRQRDFSGGEMVEYAKRRDDEAVVRAAARDLQNVRILATGGVENRPGRTIAFQSEGRTEDVRMSPTTTYRLCFGDGTWTIRDENGVVVVRAYGYAWTAATAKEIIWDRYDNDIIACFPDQIPKIARWDGGTDWTFLDFRFDVLGTQKRCPFYRIAPKGITLTPSGTSGSITITLSDDYFDSGMVGTYFRFNEQQMILTGVSDPKVGTASVQQTLSSNSHKLTWSTLIISVAVNDVLIGQSTGAIGLVTNVTGSTSADVSLQTSAGFQNGEFILRGQTRVAILGTVAQNSPTASVVWDEEVITAFRGWPRSVVVDQNRLIFSDLPGIPSMIAWSAIGLPHDHLVGATATDAFQELVPKRTRVYHVCGGADEFVFTEDGLYYIPISESNPLVPGSVSFRAIPSVPASRVEPVSTPQGVLYVPEPLDGIMALVGTGQAAQPYITRGVSELHAHLFSGVVCIAVENSPEGRVFAVNGDGSVAVGRYQPGKEWVGWLPWDGDGDVVWASALGASVIFSTDYGTYTLVEQLAATRYLDASITINDLPVALDNDAGAAVLLSPSQGELIGNMSDGGGIGSAFDGHVSQAAADGAAHSASQTGYLGKRLLATFPVLKAEVYPSQDQGFMAGANMEVRLYGKSGGSDPNDGTDGTMLATTGVISNTTSMQTLNSSNTSTNWDHLWVIVIADQVGTVAVSEVKFYVPGAAAQTGSLWFFTGETVHLMSGLQYLGFRTVTAGELDLQEGDDFSADGIVAGFAWTARVEPFVGHMQAGQSVQQTIRKRQTAESAVAVQQSTGFAIEQFVPNRTQDPDDGTWREIRRAAAYRAGENQEGAPPQREYVETFTPSGSDHDPRIRVVKDTPGTLRILEIDVQIEA